MSLRAQALDGGTHPMYRRSIFASQAIAIAIILGMIVPALADVTPFTAQAFESAQKDNKPILVEIHASWCPTCKAQKAILNNFLLRQPKFEHLIVFRVDFDSQKDVVRQFGARIQATLIVYKGSKEVGRSVGDTDPASIAALLDKTL
jgi:thioredoxin 1